MCVICVSEKNSHILVKTCYQVAAVGVSDVQSETKVHVAAPLQELQEPPGGHNSQPRYSSNLAPQFMLPTAQSVPSDTSRPPSEAYTTLLPRSRLQHAEQEPINFAEEIEAGDPAVQARNLLPLCFLKFVCFRC